jgi:hypothetical protein
MFAMPEIVLPPIEMVRDLSLYAVLPAMGLAALVTGTIAKVCAGGQKADGAKRAAGAAAVGFILGALLGVWLRAGFNQDWAALPEPVTGSRYEQWLREALTLTNGDSSWNRLLWAALGVLCVGRIARLPSMPAVDAWILRASAALAAAWWVIPEDTRTQMLWLPLAFAAVILAEWWLLEHLCAEPPGGTVPLTLSLAFFTASVVLIHAGSARLTEAATILSAALAGVALAGFVFRADTSGVAPLTAVLLPGLLLMQQQTGDSEVEWYTFGLAAGAPLALALSLPMLRAKGFLLRLLQFILVLVPLAGAFWFALEAGPLVFE